MLDGRDFVVVFDAGTGWVEGGWVKGPSAREAIRVLRTAFRTHGLCTTIVSDNGTAFTSAEFATFLRELGITHLCSPPYFPSSNGPGELGVKFVKTQFRRLPPGSDRFADALASVRLLPRADGLSPAARLMGRQPLIFLA